MQHNKVAGLKLHEVSERNIDTLIEAINESPLVMISDPGTHEPSVDEIDISTDFRVEQASEVSKELLLVAFELDALVQYIYYLPHSDYYSMDEEQSSEIAVLDSQWNEYVMQVASNRFVTFKCRVDIHCSY